MNDSLKWIALSYSIFIFMGMLILLVNLWITTQVDFITSRAVWEATLIGGAVAGVGFTIYLNKHKWNAGPRKIRGSAIAAHSFETALNVLRTAFEVVKTDEDRGIIVLIDRTSNRMGKVTWERPEYGNSTDPHRENGESDGDQSKRVFQISTYCRYPHVVDVGSKNKMHLNRIKGILQKS